jgi:hypothetical protein
VVCREAAGHPVRRERGNHRRGQAFVLGSSNGAGYAAQLSGGKWTKVSMPFSHALPVSDAGASGHAWAEMVNYASPVAPTLYQ